VISVLLEVGIGGHRGSVVCLQQWHKMSTSSGRVVAAPPPPNQSTTIDIPRMHECCQESRLAPRSSPRIWGKGGRERKRTGGTDVESIVGNVQPGPCLCYSSRHSSSCTNHHALFILAVLSSVCPPVPPHSSLSPAGCPFARSPHALRALRFTTDRSHNAATYHIFQLQGQPYANPWLLERLRFGTHWPALCILHTDTNRHEQT
jgi:hypothetical protein